MYDCYFYERKLFERKPIRLLRKEISTMKTKNNTSSSGIKVTIHIPEGIAESIKREKINYLYDVLKPRETKKK